MDEIKISLDTTGSNDEISVVRVDGVVDTMTSSELEKVMNSLMEQSRYRIIIDLGGVDYISSAGWGIFISNIREIRQHGGDLKLARMIANVYEIYELLEFDSILKAFDNVEKAKSDFRLSSPAADSPLEFPAPHPRNNISADRPAPFEKAAVVSTLKDAPETIPTASAQFSPDPTEARVLDLIAEDPFLSIREMKKILNSEAGSDSRLGWWQIRGILKKHDVLSKRKRFRFARKK